MQYGKGNDSYLFSFLIPYYYYWGLATTYIASINLHRKITGCFVCPELIAITINTIIELLYYKSIQVIKLASLFLCSLLPLYIYIYIYTLRIIVNAGY